MAYLFFDTETNGLPKDWKAPMSRLDNWPRVIQLAWATYNEAGIPIDSSVDLIKPDGWVVPNAAFWINNGYTTEKNQAEGLAMPEALQRFIAVHDKSEFLVAHNMEFDYNILGAEMMRYKLKAASKLIKICTMQNSINLCALPGKYGFKFPKLEELHFHLFKEGFEGAHDALCDVKATARCFFRMKEMNENAS